MDHRRHNDRRTSFERRCHAEGVEPPRPSPPPPPLVWAPSWVSPVHGDALGRRQRRSARRPAGHSLIIAGAPPTKSEKADGVLGGEPTTVMLSCYIPRLLWYHHGDEISAILDPCRGYPSDCIRRRCSPPRRRPRSWDTNVVADRRVDDLPTVGGFVAVAGALRLQCDCLLHGGVEQPAPTHLAAGRNGSSTRAGRRRPRRTAQRSTAVRGHPSSSPKCVDPSQWVGQRGSRSELLIDDEIINRGVGPCGLPDHDEGLGTSVMTWITGTVAFLPI